MEPIPTIKVCSSWKKNQNNHKIQSNQIFDFIWFETAIFSIQKLLFYYPYDIFLIAAACTLSHLLKVSPVTSVFLTVSIAYNLRSSIKFKCLVYAKPIYLLSFSNFYLNYVLNYSPIIGSFWCLDFSVAYLLKRYK